MTKHFDIKIYGQVHDVNFRYFAMQEASRRGLVGFVENQYEPDSLYIEVEGDDNSTLQKFIDVCRLGPPHAHITEFLCAKGGIKSFQIFSIKR